MPPPSPPSPPREPRPATVPRPPPANIAGRAMVSSVWTGYMLSTSVASRAVSVSSRPVGTARPGIASSAHAGTRGSSAEPAAADGFAGFLVIAEARAESQARTTRAVGPAALNARGSSTFAAFSPFLSGRGTSNSTTGPTSSGTGAAASGIDPGGPILRTAATTFAGSAANSFVK